MYLSSCVLASLGALHYSWGAYVEFGRTSWQDAYWQCVQATVVYTCIWKSSGASSHKTEVYSQDIPFFSVLPGTFRSWLSPKTTESICPSCSSPVPSGLFSPPPASPQNSDFPILACLTNAAASTSYLGVSSPLYLAAQCSGAVFPSKSSWRGNLIHRTWTMSMVIGF